MKPFADNSHTTNQQKTTIDKAGQGWLWKMLLGRLKGHWRCPMKCLDSQMENVSKIVTTSVVLHNICETFSDSCLQQWAFTDNTPDQHDTQLDHRPQQYTMQLHNTFPLPNDYLLP